MCYSISLPWVSTSIPFFNDTFVSLQIQAFKEYETKIGNGFLLFILSSPHNSPKMTLPRIRWHWNTERGFYEKLYSKQNTNVNSEEANSFLNNPNLLRLSEELSESCEGEITLKECETILNSFKTGKTPGNDGIPVEFYRVFWPLLAKFMVESLMRLITKRKCLTLKSRLSSH